ncbi:MAG: transposase [Bacteroidetes bacterium]|nr:transposase [Bacteroidota bacterium]
MGRRNHKAYSDFPLQFVTTSCNEWLPLLTDIKHLEILRDSILYCMNKYTVALPGYVFMPNHTHMMMLFKEDFRISDFMRDFKKHTSIHIRESIEKQNQSLLLCAMEYKTSRQQYKVWNDRFDSRSLEHPLRALQKLNYIHQNPVRKNLVTLPEDYKYSSAGYYKGKEDLFLPVDNIFELMGWDEGTYWQ